MPTASHAASRMGERMPDRSYRPVPCPQQMPAPVEAAALELRCSRAYLGSAPAGLSIQLSGWMLLEADYQLTSAGH
jgi:hypothetical protein